jgi:Flp pilus assembly protein TadG
MKKSLKRLCQALPDTQQNRLAHFHRDESGSMVVFTLFIIVLMLIVSGMAVDFMRFESRRAMMQGAVDSAVLAAADLDLDASIDPRDVVDEYMTKSQAGNCLTNVDVDDSTLSYRSVSADCQMVMNTFFLRLIGINDLTATAASTAIEGVGDIEVSLVVDISGSMILPTADGTERKIEALRSAANSFVDTLLLPEFEDRISMSLVPYSAHVNVGSDIFGTLGVTSRHGFSHCVDVPNSAFSTTEWVNGGNLIHTEHVAMGGGTINTICPRFGYEAIIPLSQDAGEIKSAINQLEPRSTTSIFQGIKWGTTLLDPSFNENVRAMGNVVEPVFQNRPSAYPDPNSTSDRDVRKYLVLMTDGENFPTDRLTPEAYDTPSEIAMWDTMGFSNFFNDITARRNLNYYHRPYHSAAQGNIFMDQICTAAKDEGIIIFGIGLYSQAANPPGADHMRNCASSESHYFETGGEELTQIFEAIANQITDLRLTQ